MCKPKIVIAISLFFLHLVSIAQPVSFNHNPDSLSWTMYQQARWDELLDLGKRLTKNGIDYYYLRMRLAVAAIEKGYYDDAVVHLQKALRFNPHDAQARKLLALALQYNLMPAEAGSMYAKLPKEFRDQTFVKPGFTPLAFHADIAQTVTDLRLSNDFQQLAGPSAIYGSASGLSESGFTDVGLWMQLKPGWLLYGGVQTMQHRFETNYAFISPKRSIDKIAFEGNFKHYYYRVDSLPLVFDASAAVKQNTFHVQLRHAPTHRFQLLVAGNLGKVSGEYPYSYLDVLVFRDTARIDLNTGLTTLHTTEVQAVKIGYTSWKTTDWRIALGGMVHNGRVSMMVGAHRGQVNNVHLLQIQAGYLWRLRANARTWQQSEVFVLQSDKLWRSAMKISAGHWFNLKTGVSFTFMKGHLNGMSDQWGYLTFNHRDNVNMFAETSLMQNLFSRLYISLRYRFAQTQLNIEQFTENQIVTKKDRLSSHGFIGGLVWNF